MGTFVLDEDDEPIGRILSRREILGLLGGSALLAACAPAVVTSPSASAAATAQAVSTTAAAASIAPSAAVVLPSCVVRPALTEGPDIRPEPSTNAVKPGATLGLTFLVSRVSGTSCTALAGATVDVWHCDALGVYSDATDPSFGSTKGTKFLRGYQTTDAGGKAVFTTIWPGWYQGRAVHIHFKIRTTAANGQVSDFTSQLFFPDAMNDAVFAAAPYSQKGTAGIMRNASDGIFQGSGGKLTLSPARTADGYTTTFDIGLAA